MKIVKYGDGASSRPAELYVIKNSAVVRIGGPVKLAEGALEPADAAADYIYGICVGFVGKDNETPYDKLLPGQVGAGTTYVHGVSLEVNSDNETEAQLRAKVVPVMPNDILRGVADADLATTTGSDKYGYYINVNTANESQFAEDSATSATEQFLIVGHPGGDQPRAIDVKVVEGQIFGQ